MGSGMSETLVERWMREAEERPEYQARLAMDRERMTRRLVVLKTVFGWTATELAGLCGESAYAVNKRIRAALAAKELSWMEWWELDDVMRRRPRKVRFA